MRNSVIRSFCLFLFLAAVCQAQDLQVLIKERSKLASDQNLQAVVDLLKANPKLANQDIKRVYGRGEITPLNEALALGDVGLAAVLIEHGADTNAPSGRVKMRPLHWAMNDIVNPENIATAINLLLAHGADPNLTDKRGGNALHRWAARRSWADVPSYTQIGKALVDAKVAIEGSTEAMSTPLIVAVVNNNPTAVKFLLENGADPDHKARLGTAREIAQKEAARNSARPEAKTVLSLISGK